MRKLQPSPASVGEGFLFVKDVDYQRGEQFTEGVSEAPLQEHPQPADSSPSQAKRGAVAALCVRSQSIYHVLPGVECYDAKRDARTYQGPCPVVAHPPCAQWGRLKGLATPDESLKSLGPLCVENVRRWGGVLEHPAASSLWEAANIPLPASRDKWGFTISISQAWFGHRADKITWLYVCGLSPADLEPLPAPIFNGARSIESMGLTEREATPPALARWLVAVARRCVGNDQVTLADLGADQVASGHLELWEAAR